MRVVQFSDCHLFSDKSRTGYAGINPYQSLARILAAVADSDPDLILVTGDLSGDDSIASYRHFQQLIKQVKPRTQIRIIAGNHDVPEHLKQMFAGQYRTDQLETIRNIDFLFLNTHHEGTLGFVDIELIKSGFEGIHCSENPLVIVMHHHPIDTGSWVDKHELVNRKAFCDILMQFARPLLLIHGHIHHASNKKLGHATVMSCPSTCWQWQMAQDFAVSHEAPGFRLFELSGDHRWESRVIRV